MPGTPEPRANARQREFAERVVAGERPVHAYAASYRRQVDATTHALASRALRNRAVNAYMDYLRSRAEAEVYEPTGAEVALTRANELRAVRDRLKASAELSREEVLTYLAEVILRGPADLLYLDDPASDFFGRPRPEMQHLCQSLTVSPRGEIRLTMFPKADAVRMYVSLREYDRPEGGDENFSRAICKMLGPSHV